MKQSVTIAKTILFFLFFSLISCEKDFNENADIKAQAPFERKFLNADELPAEFKDYITQDPANTTAKLGSADVVNDAIFIPYDIIRMTDDKKNTNYSISFLYEDTPENVFYNLIINVSPTGQSSKYIFKYTCNPADFQNFKSHNFDFKYFVGVTEIRNVSDNANNKLTAKSNSGDDPCPSVFIPSTPNPGTNPGAVGGGSGAGPTSGGYYTSVPGYNTPAHTGGGSLGPTTGGSDGHDHSDCYGSNGEYWHRGGDLEPPHSHTGKAAGDCPEVVPPPGYVPVNTTAAIIADLKTWIVIDRFQIRYLTVNPDVLNLVYTHINNSGANAQDRILAVEVIDAMKLNPNFAAWALNFMHNNPNVSLKQFANWYMGVSEGQDGDYDALYWENPNLTFPQQNLPSYNDYVNGMARFENGNLMTGADNVYALVGGNVQQARIADKVRTENTCALKVCIALNRSGVIIPYLPGKTIEGGGEFEGKYFFLNAKSLNSWMRETFGTNPASTTNPYNANHISYSKADGGANGINFPNVLQGKKGIYSMITTNAYNSSNNVSGHADLLFTDSNNVGNCAFGCFFNLPVERIDVWLLN